MVDGYQFIKVWYKKCVAASYGVIDLHLKIITKWRCPVALPEDVVALP
jgi:hypothetical protein